MKRFCLYLILAATLTAQIILTGTITQDPGTGVITANATTPNVPKVHCVVKPNGAPISNLYITCDIGAVQVLETTVTRPYVTGAETLDVHSATNAITMIFKPVAVLPPGTASTQLTFQIVANGNMLTGSL